VRRILVAFLTLGLAVPAAAQTVPEAGLQISDGAPSLYATNGVRWQVCRPDAPCVLAGSRLLGGDSFDPAWVGARVEAIKGGTIDRATDGRLTITGGTVVRTGTWLGSPVALTPPTIAGTAATGSRVTITPGTWSGGWGDGVDRLGAIACPAPDGTGFGCRVLRTARGEAPNTFVIHDDLAGWYVRGVSTLLSADMARDTSGRLLRGLHPSQAFTTALPIALAPPTVDLRSRMSRFAVGYGVGRLHCFTRQCAVTITATLRKRTVTHTTTLLHGVRSLLVPREKRLKPGLWRVTVTVDGQRRASGLVRLPRP
jgi:hypothetical protein